jgi:hypothetical protein
MFRALRSLPFACALIVGISRLLMAQEHRWEISIDGSGGAFLPAKSLGVIGVTRARLRSSPTLGVGLELGRTGSRMAVRLSTQQSLRGGMTFHPTAECQQACSSWKDDHGRFWGAALDIVGRFPFRSLGVAFGIGGGLREYHVGGFDCTCTPAPAGYPDAGPFLKNRMNAALHFGVSSILRLRGLAVRLGLEDYVGRGPAHEVQHDLVLGGGIVVALRKSQNARSLVAPASDP